MDSPGEFNTKLRISDEPLFAFILLLHLISLEQMPVYDPPVPADVTSNATKERETGIQIVVFSLQNRSVTSSVACHTSSEQYFGLSLLQIT